MKKFKFYSFILSVVFIFSPLLSDETRKPINKISCLDKGICHQLFSMDGTIVIEFTNQNKTIPLTVIVEYNDAQNLDLEAGRKDILLISPNEIRSTDFIQISDPNKRWSINYPFRFYQGDITQEMDADYVYRLPFRNKHLLTQGYNGIWTHQGKNALDFDMPEKTPILAAREGVVTDFADHFTIGGNNPSLKAKANFVTILHEDGSSAFYGHLYPKGVQVKIGQIVRKGQQIGLSGNTGYSTNPHLHFQVMKPIIQDQGVDEPTVPTFFQTESSLKDSLVEQNFYWHEDTPLSEIPFIAKDYIKICNDFNDKGEVFNCTSVRQKGNIVVQLYVFKPKIREYEFYVYSQGESAPILKWKIESQKDWSKFYTYTSSSNLNPGKYQLVVRSENLELDPIPFVVKK
ncbi:MAG: M23 family metallopeptidase [Leptospira sp.]|nr:M23 family metallopeptidase [Leptospira sp.]